MTFLKTSLQPADEENESPLQILSNDRIPDTIKSGAQGRQSGSCGREGDYKPFHVLEKKANTL